MILVLVLREKYLILVLVLLEKYLVLILVLRDAYFCIYAPKRVFVAVIGNMEQYLSLYLKDLFFL